MQIYRICINPRSRFIGFNEERGEECDLIRSVRTITMCGLHNRMQMLKISEFSISIEEIAYIISLFHIAQLQGIKYYFPLVPKQEAINKC